MKKRITSLLMALIMALSLIPATVWAEDAPTEVSTFEKLKAAVDEEKSDIVLTADIDLTEPLLIDSATANITIRSKEGETFTLKRAESFTSYAINVKDGGKLTLENITLDGNGEVVQSSYPFIYMRSTNVNKQTDSELHLKSGATIQNCVTKDYPTWDGGAINSSGSVYMYEGSAITNCSSQAGGAIRLYYTPSSPSTITKFANFTMYGGTISGCSATGSSDTAHGGGALYAYGNVNVNLLGGVIEKNTSAANGGGVFVQPYQYNGYINTATLNLAGTTIQDNTATRRGGGVYFNGDTQDVITASKVTTITGNSGMNGTDNVYLVAGRSLTDNGLEAGSAIGVSSPNVPSLLVTGTDNANGYYTADRVDAKLVAAEGGLQLAAKDVHEHCICGRTDCKETGTGHRKIICTGVSSPELITTKGDYFLMNDAELSYNKNGNSWTAPAGVTLCLNGHTLRRGSSTAAAAIVVTGGNTFDLTDCQNNTGKVTSSYFSSEYNRDEALWGTGVSVAKNATFNMYGGTISGNTAYDPTNIAAGGVVVNGTFNMYGGQLVNNYRRTSTETLGSAVMIFAGGTFNLVDGLIARNASQDTEYGSTNTTARNGGAVYVKGGTFNMSGGEISKNVAGSYKAASDGGAVYVANSGVFNMTGGEITGNTARRSGGGVAVASGTFTMSQQARVTGNTASRDSGAGDESNTYSGGGVYVGADGTFIMNDSATVDANKAICGLKDQLARGGGVYVENGGVFTMNDQSAVKDNQVPISYTSSFSDSVFGGGIYVNGTLNLNGGSVTGNKAYLRGGGIYVDTKAAVNLGTGTVTVKDNTIHNGDFTDNVYLAGDTKLVSEKAPAKDTSIGISVPLSRATAGSVVITNAEGSIKANDARFPRDISEINLERSDDDLKVTLLTHKHGAVTYTPVERLSDIKGAGNYYLVQDSLMTSQLTVAADTTVKICLNGHKSASTNIINNGTLTITDCKHDDGTGYLTSNYNVAITNNTEYAKLTLDSVTVQDAKGTFINVNEDRNTETNHSGGSTVNLLSSTFTNNRGTVLDAYGTTITVRNCTFDGNKNCAIFAPYSYSLYTATITVENSKFIGNSTTSSFYGGGAIYCTYISGITITGCTFTGNTALEGNGNGGALYLQGKKMKISNCTFTGNSAKWGGGAIYVPYTGSSDSDEYPVLSGKIIAEDNTANGVRNNVHLDGRRSNSAYISVDSSFNTARSNVGISADNIPTLAVKGTTDPTGFFADGGSDYTLRSTTDKSGPLLTSGNTGLELWHKGTGHTHCVCGTGSNKADSNHTTHEKIKWIGVTTLKDLPEGNYFLLNNVVNYPYGAPWNPVGSSNLCLNGFTYAASADSSYAPCVVVSKNVNASITDCSDEGTGKLTAGTSGHQGVSVADDATFTLWRGSLSKFQADSSSYSSYDYRKGGGAYVLGTFVMNGGSITGCTATGNNGGGVYVEDGTFIMNAGSITGCSTKTKSTSSGIGNGGAVYGIRSTITINGGTITDNKATNGGGVYTSYCDLTVDGTTITGNTATGSGGGLYIGPARYYESSKRDSSTKRTTYTYTYQPAVINNSTISNNSADIGGGIASIGPFHFSGGTAITSNTATSAAGGVHSAAIAKTSTTYNIYVGWTIELSGDVNISGNKVGEAASNYYIPAETGTMLPSVTSLAEGSSIGVTTEAKTLLDDGTIAKVYITSDAGETKYFTSDEGYDVKLDDETNQLYIIAQVYTVTITPGEGMTTEGSLTQNILKAAGSAMTDVVVKAKDGYYFPEGYGFTQDGITVTRDSFTQLTISGTPTADVALTLPAATAKNTPAAPTGLTGVAPTGWTATDGAISGTKTTMEWATSPDSETWTECSEGTTTVGGNGTYYVRLKATDTSYVSEIAEVVVPRYLKAVDFPKPTLSFFYNGYEKAPLLPEEGYDIKGDTKATNAGTYSVSLTLQDGYKWTVAPTSDTFTWFITKKTATAADFTFTPPQDLVYNGSAKAAEVTLNAPMTLNGNNLTVVYKDENGKQVVPTALGTYHVYVSISGSGNFYATAKDITADTWVFTITHPKDAAGNDAHDWGAWEHDEYSHWHSCTIPGCTVSESGGHQQATAATCTQKAMCSDCHAEYGALDAHNHPADKVTSTPANDPTCGSAGNEAYSYCADCQKYFSGKTGDTALYDNADHFTIDALNHQNVVKTPAVAADCENGGHEAYWQCTDCHQYFADKNGEADLSKSYANASDFNTAPLNHAGATKTAEDPATCTEGGRDAYWYCSACGGYFADTNGTLDPERGGSAPEDFNTDPLGHDYTAEVVAPKHLKTAATCTDDAVYYKSCVLCGENGTETFTAAGTALGHDFTGQPYQHDDQSHWQICKRDDCTAESAHEAHAGAAATCVAESHCTACDYKLADKDPHNHTSGTLHAANAPTCTAKGNEAYYSCSGCGKFYSGQDGDTALYDSADHFDIDPLNHKDAAKTDYQAPTCENGGHDAYWYCAKCGKYFADKSGSIDLSKSYDSADTFALDKLGHDYTGQPYLSSAEGHWQLCKREGCGHPSLLVKHTGGTATCTEPKTCEVCQTKYGDPLGHAPASEWTKDETGHWHICQNTGCTEKLDFAVHTPDRTEADYENPILCSDCGYEISPKRPDVDVTVTIPFSVTVKKTGEAAPGKESFKLTFAGAMPDGLKDYVTIVNDTIETNGEKTYTGDFVFTIKASKLRYISDGIQLTQVKGSAEGWTYDDALYYVTFDIDFEDEKVALRDVGVMGEGDEFIPLDPKEDGSPLVAFTNSYSASLPTPPVVKTGDSGITLWVSLAALSGLVMIAIPELKKRKTHC